MPALQEPSIKALLMFVIDGLKTNKFVSVPIPSGCEIFQRLSGKMASSIPESAYSGDADTRPMSKIDAIVAGEFLLNEDSQQTE